MRCALGLLLALAACATPEVLPVPPPEPIVVPAELRACPAQPAAITPPPPPRTFASVIEWGRQTDQQRERTAFALEICRARLQWLLALIRRVSAVVTSHP